MTVEWAEPPKSHARKGKWEEIAAELREHPGDWARVVAGANSPYGTHIARGTLAAFRPAGAFEATTRRHPDHTFDTYARFVGDPK